jgi:hypothetical protein
VTLFSTLRWDWHGFDKKYAETCYTELLFLHPVGSVGHIVHSIGFGERNGDALFFMLGWDWYGFNKKCVGAHYAELVFLHPMGFGSCVVHSGASVE